MPTFRNSPTGAAAFAILVLGATSCTSWQRVSSGDRGPGADQGLLQLFDPAGTYRQLGRMVGAGTVPFVGSVAYVAGPGSSTRAIVGVSLANRAFAFERMGDLYEARYRIEYTLATPGQAPRALNREGVLRVATQQEAARIDESLLLQEEFVLPAGSYDLTVRVVDRANQQSSVATETIGVPEFRPGSTTAPIFAYEVEGRGSRADSLRLVMNSRGSLAYGGDTLLIYLEGYGFGRPDSVPVEVRDERDQVIFSSFAKFSGNREVEGQIVRVAPDSSPLGRLRVSVGGGAGRQENQALVSFSGNWVITNFDDLVALLRYFGEDTRLNRMRDAEPAERLDLWREFYRVTDPIQATPENEALDAYFARLAAANQQFRDEGIPGWRTERGEVFVVLGPPDEVYNATATQQGRFLYWTYHDLRVRLMFEDPTGFGRYRLTTESRGEFERVRSRVERRRQ